MEEEKKDAPAFKEGRRGRPKGTSKSEVLEEVRESGYNENTPKLLLKLFQEGKLPPQVCKLLRIRKKTFNEWLEKYPEFHKAYELGIVACEAYWVEQGIEGLKHARNFNFNQWMSFMSNIFKWTKAGGEAGSVTNITKIGSVTQVNKYEQYTDQQLREFLLAKIENSKIIDLEVPKLEMNLKTEILEDQFKDQSGVIDAEIELGGDPSQKV